jgi:hypothetical protein
MIEGIHKYFAWFHDAQLSQCLLRLILTSKDLLLMPRVLEVALELPLPDPSSLASLVTDAVQAPDLMTAYLRAKVAFRIG